MEFSDFLLALAPFLSEVAVLLLGIAGAIALFFVVRAVSQNEEAKRLILQYQWLLEVAGDVVIRIAFTVTDEELAEYQQEAAETGRDIRLVTAYNELMDLAEQRGITLDLREAIGIVERVYQRLYDAGTLTGAKELPEHFQ